MKPYYLSYDNRYKQAYEAGMEKCPLISKTPTPHPFSPASLTNLSSLSKYASIISKHDENTF